MSKFAEEGRLDGNIICSIMQEEKPNRAEQFKMPRERISKYSAPRTPAEFRVDEVFWFTRNSVT
ncbi:MAG: hypothetical protein LBK41_05275 [Clostridiales bacterium]|nr:hypothetical protein [Clostridiales bacterium]